MTSLSFDGDFDSVTGSKERTFANSNVSLIKVWNVVISIYLVNIIKTALLDHRKSSSWSFFSWLEQQTDKLVLWDFIFIVIQDLCNS